MAADQVGRSSPGMCAVLHHPAAADHDPVGAMGAAEHSAASGSPCAGKAQFVELEQREVGLRADTDRAQFGPANAGGGALASPSAARPCG